MSLSEALIDKDMVMQPISNTSRSLGDEIGVHDEEMDDLFGEDTELDQTKLERDPSTPLEADAISDAEQRHREAMEYAEQDDAEHDPNTLLEQLTEANAPIPNIPTPKSSDDQNWVIRMPNFVKVDSKPFHPDTYIGPEQEEEDMAGAENMRERSMSIKLKVENTLRWRWIKDERGDDQRQSNSRIIRWSDGTLSLLLGKELFDISQQVDTSLAHPRTTINGSQSQSRSQSAEPPSSQSTKNQGLTYLVAQHKRAEILQSEALISGYMTLRPTGMQSETHRMLVRAVGQKHNKVARLRMAPDPTTDPEREKLELIKTTAKSKPKRPKYDDDALGMDGGSGRKRRSYSRRRSGDGVWSDDEEEDDAERDVFGASDEDEDIRTPRKKNKRMKKEPATGGDYQNDDFVVPDSPSYDGDSDPGNSSKKKGRRKGQSNEPEDDDLDRLDAKIEQAERMREHPISVSGETEGQQQEPEEMDVESEEPEEPDDEEHEIRKAGAGGTGRTRRLAHDLDEEE